MAAPAVKSAAAVLSQSGPANSSAAAAAQGEGTLFANMALSGLAGRAEVGTGAAGRSAGAGGGVATGETSCPVNIFIVPGGAQ